MLKLHGADASARIIDTGVFFMLKNYDVAVVFGGISNEHEVSIITGTMACNVLKKAGKSVLPVYITRKGDMRAGDELGDIGIYGGGSFNRYPTASVCNGGMVLFNKRGKPKCVVFLGCALNCCHGGAGEGGAVAGLFEMNNIPFASAGLFESAAFIDKYYTKLILKSLSVKVAKYRYCRDVDGAVAGANELGYPVIVKPCKLGSSIGIEKAENEEQLKAALETAFALDDGVLIEEFLSPRREINCAAYFANGEVVTSPCEEVFTSGDLLSYDDKYSGGGSRKFPADLTQKTENSIRAKTERIYKALSFRGIVRFDYIIRGQDIFVSEINTVPGSLSQYLLSESFSSFGGVLLSLIMQAKEDFAQSRSKLKVTTGILNNIPAGAVKLK